MRLGFAIWAGTFGNGAPRVTKAAAQAQAVIGAFCAAGLGQPAIAPSCNLPIGTWSIATIATSSTDFAASSRRKPTTAHKGVEATGQTTRGIGGGKVIRLNSRRKDRREGGLKTGLTLDRLSQRLDL